MQYTTIHPFQDPQCASPVTVCAYCGCGLYETDMFYAINGHILCEDCLPTFAREEYRSFRLTGREWRLL